MPLLPPPSCHFVGASPSREEETPAFIMLSLSPVLTALRTCFELRIAMGTAAPREHQHDCPRSPVLKWMVAKQIIGKKIFFF